MNKIVSQSKIPAKAAAKSEKVPLSNGKHQRKQSAYDRFVAMDVSYTKLPEILQNEVSRVEKPPEAVLERRHSRTVKKYSEETPQPRSSLQRTERENEREENVSFMQAIIDKMQKKFGRAHERKQNKYMHIGNAHQSFLKRADETSAYGNYQKYIQANGLAKDPGESVISF